MSKRSPMTHPPLPITPLRIAPRLRAILSQEYPRFSDAEYARRHKALGAVMEKAGVDHLLVITDTRAGNAPQWVTGWPGTVEAYGIFRPGEKMWMSVEWVNHYPLAKKIGSHMDVVWGEHKGLDKMIAELKRRGAKRVGIMGPLRSEEHTSELQSLRHLVCRLLLEKTN